MPIPRVIPTLLLKNSGLVKTLKFKDPKYVGDPINAVKIFNEKEVDELIFLDITATSEGKEPSLKMLKDIASECFMPLAYGGGINSLDQIQEIIKVGIEKVVISTKAVQDPDFVKRATERFGTSTIAVSIDVKKKIFGKYEIYTDNGRERTRLDPVEFAELMDKNGAGELIVNSIEKDGVMQGYDLELISKIADKVNMPVIASCGAGKYDDFASAIKAGASAVSAGSLFVFHGKHRAILISYPSYQELKELFTGIK